MGHVKCQVTKVAEPTVNKTHVLFLCRRVGLNSANVYRGKCFVTPEHRTGGRAISKVPWIGRGFQMFGLEAWSASGALYREQSSLKILGIIPKSGNSISKCLDIENRL